MSMFTLRRSQKQSGFTLMELLIVIAVLGLLLGMLIPRLAGITDDTVDTVCDTNNKGTRYLTQMYINKYNAWPDGLTNLVDLGNTAQLDDSGVTMTSIVSGTSTATPQIYMPYFQYDDQEEAKILSADFWTRNVPGVYTLGSDEIAELKDMGITTVYNLTGENRDMEKMILKDPGDEDDITNVVMMMGMSNSKADEAPSFNFTSAYPVGNPEWVGRIMLAVNDKCDLVKKGILQASALCPGAVLAEEDFEHKHYILVLPRLQATVDLFGSGSANTMDGVTFTFYDSSAGSSAGADDIKAATQLEVTFEAQAVWEFDMSCPEGHKWPDNDEDSWIYTSNDGSSTPATVPTTSGTYSPTTTS